jgi:hypothetical protein
MPAKSKQQQKFMGMVHALNKGDIKPSDVSQSVRDVAKNIKKSDAEDFASTKHSGLPKKVKEQILNALKEYANKMAGNKHGGSGSYGYAPQKGLRDDDGYDNMDEKVSPKVLKALNLGLKKINRKFKGASLDGKTIDIELYSGHNRDSEIYQIYDLLKKLKLDKHKTSIFNDNVNYGDDEGPKDESVNEGYGDWVKAKNLTDIIKLSKQKKNATFYVTDDNNSRIGSFYLKNGKFAKATTANPNYDLQRNKTKLKDRSDVIYKYKVDESVNEGMFSTLDQIRQDSKDVRDFVKNVFKDRDFMKMKNDKEFIKYLKSIYEGVDESKGVPQNYMQGRTSDYHTALRGKNRDYSGGTNFKKSNSGQPDIKDDDEDQETNQLSVQQTKLKEEMGNLTSAERIELYKLYSKAMKAMPGSPNQKKIKVLINKLRKKADLKPLPMNEAKLDHHRISGNSIELLVRHNRVKYAIKFKDKRILDKMGFDWSKPKNIEKLLSIKKLPKGMSISRSFHEYGQRLDLSYLEDEEARLDGTPKPKDAIDRDIDENVKQMTSQILRMKKGEMKVYELPSKTQKFYYKNKKRFDKLKEYSGGSYEYTKGDQYGQNSVNEIGVFPITSYMKGIIPADFVNTTTRDKKERLKSTLRDLKSTLNRFWKQHKIPYRIK